VRIAVNEFAPNRAQRRTLARNADLSMHARPPRFEREHFLLYEHYLKARHPDSHMDSTNPSAYMSFLTALWCDTTFYEFRRAQDLLAVAVVDRLGDGLSAVYTFFAPAEADRSLGRLAVLKQVEWAAAMGLPWLYLGYWIRDCRKMSYKHEYAPLEFYINGEWRRDADPA
jgi:arginine-tRNA-protein transferase